MTLRTLAVTFVLVVAPAASAAPCAGFVDVDSTDAACPSVDWLRNRAITLGCSVPNSYCPIDPVIRLSMAAFLNRLGLALTDDVRYADATNASLDPDNPPATLCATTAAAITSYPRQADVVAAFSAQAGGTLANVDVRIVQSTDGGATWTPLTTHPAVTGGVQRWIDAATSRHGIPLAVGGTYRFGVAVSRSTSAASTGDLGSWTCQVKAVLRHRSGTSAPF